MSNVRCWGNTLRLPLVEMARGAEILIAMFDSMRRMASGSPLGQIDFLPPGVGDPRGPCEQSDKPEPRIIVRVPERLRFIEQMGPVQTIGGLRMRGAATPYIAFVFRNVVVLQCETCGNAAYVFVTQPGWINLAQRPKTELIRERPSGFIRRITHNGDWKDRIRSVVMG